MIGIISVFWFVLSPCQNLPPNFGYFPHHIQSWPVITFHGSPYKNLSKISGEKKVLHFSHPICTSLGSIELPPFSVSPKFRISIEVPFKISLTNIVSCLFTNRQAVSCLSISSCNFEKLEESFEVEIRIYKNRVTE